MKTKSKDLVLWGFHPAHGAACLKIFGFSKKAQRERTSEGWTCAGYAPGERPAGLLELTARACLAIS